MVFAAVAVSLMQQHTKRALTNLLKPREKNKYNTAGLADHAFYVFS